ncbi:MAG TPA: quinoprotein dehydrogenase-associated SoxYZ-like carrier [Stellaceae bacterium]|nr:quinoprotein dehydrogenase-associated SoxYZ-like carrier [Stellaceae bacterium]
MGVIRTMLGRAALVLMLMGFALPGPACAEPTEAERMARWADLRHTIFGDRAVEEAADLVAIDAPARAEDAAIVPVAIRVAETLAPEIRGLYLVIDNNPSPLAAHFLLAPIADAREIGTRVRIDDYTYVHAVAETADGRLYATARFIKAAGGCSAPAGKDQALALERLGKMKLNLADRSRPDEPIRAKLLISHPNSSGLQMDQATRNYIPADFMQTLDVTYNGRQVFRLESDIAISEDPSFNFSFRAADPAAVGVIKAEILDSSQRHFSQSWPVPAAAQM